MQVCPPHATPCQSATCEEKVARNRVQKRIDCLKKTLIHPHPHSGFFFFFLSLSFLPPRSSLALSSQPSSTARQTMALSKSTIAAASGIIVLGVFLVDRTAIPAAAAALAASCTRLIFGKRGPRSKQHQRSFTSQEQGSEEVSAGFLVMNPIRR